jgi:ubiquinone/menaquinone biosynthesis C-methylase UbiE
MSIVRPGSKIRGSMERWYSKLTRYRWDVYTSMFQNGRCERLVGLGIGDGSLTVEVSQYVNAREVFGIDLDQMSLTRAKSKGIITIKSDLNKGLPLADSSIDVVSSDQVIEHLIDVDRYMAEINRILKPGGYAVICTENLSAIHNLFSIAFGKQAFSQMISTKYRIGNQFYLDYMKRLDSAFPHIHIFTLQGLKDLCLIYGFCLEKIRGIGYFPLAPLSMGKIFERIDPVHAYFLSIRIRRPSGKKWI